MESLVAPHVGAWIEICGKSRRTVLTYVAPHVGAWIEIFLARFNTWAITCRSSCRSVD